MTSRPFSLWGSLRSAVEWRVRYARRVAGRVAKLRRTLGLRGAFDLARAMHGPDRGSVRTTRVRGYPHPLHFRTGTSDPWVIEEVFHAGEYRGVGAEPEVRTIIDCGANIGCTAAYLLARYPAARLVAVEPDPENMRVCRLNLAPFADRVTFVQEGVWSRNAGLVVVRGEYRHGGATAFQVREAAAGEAADCSAVTVDELMRAGGFDRIDLLKMDIEAGEAEVFRPGAESWLARTRTLVIEIHGPACQAVVDAMMSRFPGVDARQAGELAVYRGMDRAARPS